MQGTLLAEAFRYNRWANLQLLADCQSLSAEQLRITASGTYGTIGDTFMHLLSAEQRYVRRLSGVEPRISENDAFPGIDALMRDAEVSGQQLIELADKVSSADEIEPGRLKQYSQLAAGIVLLQAMHHGNDHRTHICTILGAHGLEYRDLDVWAYGLATGAARVA